MTNNLKRKIFFSADNTELNETIGNRIEQARIAEKMSRIQLSSITGIPHELLRQYELDIKEPRPKNLTKLSDGLMWTKGSLLYGGTHTVQLSDNEYVISCRQLTVDDLLLYDREGYMEFIAQMLSKVSTVQLDTIYQILMFYTCSDNDQEQFDRMIEEYIINHTDIVLHDSDLINMVSTADVKKAKDMRRVLERFKLHETDMSFKQMRNITNAIKRVVAKVTE